MADQVLDPLHLVRRRRLRPVRLRGVQGSGARVDGRQARDGAVSGGLVAALGTFSAEWATRCGAMVAALDDAGAAAATSVARYRGDDHQAQAGSDALGF